MLKLSFLCRNLAALLFTKDTPCDWTVVGYVTIARTESRLVNDADRHVRAEDETLLHPAAPRARFRARGIVAISFYQFNSRLSGVRAHRVSHLSNNEIIAGSCPWLTGPIENGDRAR